MTLTSMGTMGDLVQSMTSLVDDERSRIIGWLRAHQDQHERAIAAGACSRGSTTHGELRDQAAYYGMVADALENKDDFAWAYGFPREEWLLPPKSGTDAE